jgi:hypothetical protein
MALVLAGQPAPAAVDVVGGLSNSATPNPYNAKGNAFHVTTSTTLNQLEFYLNFVGNHALTFGVYTSPVEFGNYTLVQNSTVNRSSAGGGEFIASGPMSVPLTAGLYYITVVWPLDVTTYYFTTGASQPTSWGSQVHGFATGVAPLGATISSTDDDSAIYYERLTTTVPEPLGLGAACLTAGGAALCARRGRRSRGCNTAI